MLDARQSDRMLTTTYAGWQPTHGIPFATTIVQSTGDARYDTRYEVTATTLDAPRDAHALHRARRPPRADGGRRPVPLTTRALF